MRAIRKLSIFRPGAAVIATPLFVTALLAACPANAAQIDVKAGCSLTQAISAANGDVVVGSCTKGSGHDDIVLAAGPFNVSSALEIWSDVTIRGAGMAQTTIISSNVNPPSFQAGMGECNGVPAAVYINAVGSGPVDGALSVRFKDLTLKPASTTVSQGFCEHAGSLYLDQARVTAFQAGGLWIESTWSVPSHLNVSSSLIDSNFSNSHGGGIYMMQRDFTSGEPNPANFKISRSTISSNSSGGFGGGVYIGQDPSTVSIQPFHTFELSTISNNFALGDGGGIYDDIQHQATYLQLYRMTIAENYASGIGGGVAKVWVPPGAPGGTSDLLMFGSVFHGNESASEAATNNLTYPLSGSAQEWRLWCSDSHMYLEGSEWTAERLPADQNGNCIYHIDNPGLGGLVGKGGLNNLPVHPLLPGFPGTPLIDSSEINDYTTDTRGVASPIDGNFDAVKKADRGAYEYVPLQLETESMTVAGKSTNVTHNVLTGSAYAWYSNSGGTNLQSNQTGHYVVYKSPAAIASGTYAVTVRYKKGSNAGRFQFSRANSLNDAVNETVSYAALGLPVEGYAGLDTWSDQPLGNTTFSTNSVKYFKLKVTGKHGSSSSYRIYPDAIFLIRQ